MSVSTNGDTYDEHDVADQIVERVNTIHG